MCTVNAAGPPGRVDAFHLIRRVDRSRRGNPATISNLSTPRGDIAQMEDLQALHLGRRAARRCADLRQPRPDVSDRQGSDATAVGCSVRLAARSHRSSLKSPFRASRHTPGRLPYELLDLLLQLHHLEHTPRTKRAGLRPWHLHPPGPSPAGSSTTKHDPWGTLGS